MYLQNQQLIFTQSKKKLVTTWKMLSYSKPPIKLVDLRRAKKCNMNTI